MPKPKHHIHRRQVWYNLKRSLSTLASVKYPITAYQFASRMQYDASADWPAARIGTCRLAMLVNLGYVNCTITRRRGSTYPTRHYVLSELGVYRLFYMEALELTYHNNWAIVALDEN